MDIPFLLHSPSEAVSTIYFANVIAWLKGVADAQKSGQLLDPSAPSYDDEYALPEFSFPVFDEQPPPQPSYPCFTAETSQNWPRLSSPASITNVPSHPQPVCHDLRRSIGAAQDMWGFTPPPSTQPYVVGSPFGYVPLAVHVPHNTTLPHDPSPFYAIPPFLQDLHATSDKLQHALRQHQITSARQQWAAANPSLCSAHERSRRTHTAHITERRRRPFQATPYYKITSPYLAS